MRFGPWLVILFQMLACATPGHGPEERAARSLRVANLRRAAKLPWSDEGRCVVREASQSWPTLVERCYPTLEHERVRFRDPEGRCAVASAGAAAMGLGICVLAAPEVVVGAVVVIGVVVVAVAIHEALAAHELSGAYPEDERPAPQTKPALPDRWVERQPQPETSGQDWLPPLPPAPGTRERRPECTPQRVRHLGGNDLHNQCADRVPGNVLPGWDVLINGKRFDALQGGTRTLWEVKTNAIENYNAFVRRTELQKQVEEGRRERDLAAACHYDFVIGVRTEAHRRILKEAAPDLQVVVMTWC